MRESDKAFFEGMDVLARMGHASEKHLMPKQPPRQKKSPELLEVEARVAAIQARKAAAHGKR